MIVSRYFVDSSVWLGYFIGDMPQAKDIIESDALLVTSVISLHEIYKKFIYLFSNKMNLLGGSILFFATKGSMNDEILSTVKQFCDKTYDFSELYIASVELAH